MRTFEIPQVRILLADMQKIDILTASTTSTTSVGINPEAPADGDQVAGRANSIIANLADQKQ